MSQLRSMGLLAVLFVFVFSAPRAMAHDWKPASLAKISVAKMRPVPLKKDDGWTEIPDFLKGATIYSDVVEKSRSLDVTAESDGGILIAVSWMGDDTDNGAWKKTRMRSSDFFHQGWVWVGHITYGKDDRHVVLQKQVKKGERLHLHTRADLPPYVVVPTEEGLKFVAEVIDTDAIHDIDDIEFAKESPNFAAADHRAVMLNMHYPRSIAIHSIRTILPREFVRQAILLTAREELQLGTRDSVLRERFPQQPSQANLPLEIHTTIISQHNLHITLFRRRDGKNQVVWDKTFDLPAEKRKSLEAVTARVDKLSRKEFIEALEQAGFTGAANQKNSTADVPQPVAELLKELSFVPQFWAIRQLHQLLRTEGESPQLIQALARGYANLSVLTGRYYSISNKVFVARAWLYAERAVSATPDAPSAHWTRAYVRTLSGRHNTALEAIAEAEKLALKSGETGVPEWADIIKAVCEYDEPQLATIVNHPTYAPLARLLRLTGPMRGNSGLQTREAARVLELVPDCYFAVEAMYSHSKWNTRRQISKLSQQVVMTYLYDRLAGIPDLPEEAKIIVSRYQERGDIESDDEEAQNTEQEERVKLIRALHAAGAVNQDAGELSWGVLGQLIQELSFLHTQEYLYMEKMYSEETFDDDLDRLLPLVADHPYRSFLETYSPDDERAQDARLALEKEIDMGEMQIRTSGLITQFYYAGNQKKYYLSHKWAHFQTDPTFDDLIHAYQFNKGEHLNYWLRNLERVVPHQPYTITRALRTDWRRLENRFDELEQKYAGSIDVQEALGKRLTALGQLDAAERCLNRRLQLASESNAYIALAGLYKRQGKDDLWLQTLQKSLDEPEKSDYAETYAQGVIRVMIARHFMKQKQWETAWPYAETAADTIGTFQALLCVKDCAEGLQNWDAAEQYARQFSQTRGDVQIWWYLWCKRFDRGDEEAANEAALIYMESVTEPTADQWLNTFAAYHLINGDDESAIEPLERALKDNSNPYFGIHLALAADSSKQPKVRDAALKQVIEKGKTFRLNGRVRTEMIELAKLLREAYAVAEKPTLDLTKIDELLKQTPADERTNMDYFIGRFVDLHGDRKKAVHYLLRSAKSDEFKINRALAGALLHTHGIVFWDEGETKEP